MLRSGNKIRLTKQDRELVTLLTGETPEVTTVAALNNFLEIQKGQFAGDTPEEILLRHLVDQSKI